MQINILKKEFWKGQRLLLLAFLLLHTATSFYYISKQDITYDEPQYIEYAKRWLHGRPERIELMDDSKSPVVAICWLPRIVRQIVNPGYHLTDYGYKDQLEGRHMMILFSFLAALYVYWWCKELYGAKGWVMPLLLLFFDPLYLSYTAIITTDLACGTLLVALLYHFRQYLLSGRRQQFYLAAIFTGVAIVTKQNMLLVVFLLPVLALVYHFVFDKKVLISKKTVIDLVLFVFVILIVINLAYYFKDTFIPFGKYQFDSIFLRNLQVKLSWLRSIPIPVPKAYVQSVDMVIDHSEIGSGKPGSTYNGVYLFGELRDTGGFWYYYLVMLWYKMPIGTMVLIVASGVIFLRKCKPGPFVKNYMFLLVPIIFYGTILSFFNKFQIGVRHLLIGYPLLYIGLGKLFFDVSKAQLKYKVLTAAVVVYVFISVGVYYPYLIPYTNEFITDKKTVFRKVLDSSIDYGQSDRSVAVVIVSNPGFKKASAVPDTGKFVILMDHIVHSYLRQNNPYNWCQKLEPVAVYKYVILVYDVKEQDLVKAGLWKEKK